MTDTIGFIGLGNMGMPMIEQLLKAGYKVRAFDVSDDAFYRVDLDGDGGADVLIDEGRFACSTSASLFSPTGGAQLHAIVGDRHDVWMAQAWRLIDWGEHTILLLAGPGVLLSSALSATVAVKVLGYG